MEAAIGNSKDYTLKSYVIFVKKLQAKAEVGFHFSPCNFFWFE